MNQAFVTGGSGFLGQELIRELVDRDVSVVGLARSDSSADAVRDAGATVVRGDLSDVEVMRTGMEGCDVVFHVAARVDWTADWDVLEEVHVTGTGNVIEAARRSGVDRLVHVSTEAVLIDGSPLVEVDESEPIPDEPIGPYAQSKAMADKAVQRANDDDLSTVVLRPRFLWGSGDFTLLSQIIERVKNDSYAWIDDGEYLTSTCHIRNAVEGLVLAAKRGTPGEVYYLSDGDPIEYRTFISRLIETQGLTPPDRSIPRWLAKPFARVCKLSWRLLPLSGDPPLTPATLATIGHEVTVDDSKAREELGYEGTFSREEGFAELRADSQS